MKQNIQDLVMCSSLQSQLMTVRTVQGTVLANSAAIWKARRLQEKGRVQTPVRLPTQAMGQGELRMANGVNGLL